MSVKIYEKQSMEEGNRNCSSFMDLGKDKYHMIFTYMWNLKYDTNEPIYKTETDSQVSKLNNEISTFSCPIYKNEKV